MNTAKATSMSLLAAIALGAYADPSATVTSVGMNAETRAVTVEYTIDGDEPAVVTFDVTTNGVSVGGAAIRRVAGDVNRLVRPGSRSFVWMPLADGVSFAHDNAQVKLQAWATNAPPPYMMADLVCKSNIMFFASADALPFECGVTNDSCKGDWLVLRRIPAAGKEWRKGDGTENNPYEIVTMEADYYMGVYPVTQGQYVKMGLSNDSSQKGDLNEYETSADYRPMSSGSTSYSGVTGTAIPKFAAFTGLAFRLPSAVEWEYACRAGTSTPFNNGTVNNLAPLGWYIGNAGNHPRCVGLKLPNLWGLYDMHGNVFEWCSDASGANHVLQGGSFLHYVGSCNSTYRAATSAGTDITGFRLVCPCAAPTF